MHVHLQPPVGPTSIEFLSRKPTHITPSLISERVEVEKELTAGGDGLNPSTTEKKRGTYYSP